MVSLLGGFSFACFFPKSLAEQVAYKLVLISKHFYKTEEWVNLVQDANKHSERIISLPCYSFDTGEKKVLLDLWVRKVTAPIKKASASL